ncbi:MAG: hydrolase [Marmoricola sp.]|nr:hydrolase [Marmoricola sp.]
MPRIAVCYLVDARGHVLLQHRDEHAPRAADQWGMVGGHVEDGEDGDDAVRRELLEETGISAGPVVGQAGAPGELELWHEGPFTYSDGHRGDYRVYAGRVDLTDADVVLGEGRAIVFVDPEVALGLDLAESNAHFLPRFLTSSTYRRLNGSTPP